MGLFQVILLMCQLLSMSHVINFSIVYFSRCGAKNHHNLNFATNVLNVVSEAAK
jgi:hypothetical protein